MLPATNLLPNYGATKFIFINIFIKLMVEAGGIEPPSEGLQHKASTCLVSVLMSRARSAHRQASRPQPLFDTLQPRGLTAGFAHLNLTPKHDPMGGVMLRRATR